MQSLYEYIDGCEDFHKVKSISDIKSFINRQKFKASQVFYAFETPNNLRRNKIKMVPNIRFNSILCTEFLPEFNVKYQTNGKCHEMIRNRINGIRAINKTFAAINDKSWLFTANHFYQSKISVCVLQKVHNVASVVFLHRFLSIIFFCSLKNC